MLKIKMKNEMEISPYLGARVKAINMNEKNRDQFYSRLLFVV